MKLSHKSQNQLPEEILKEIREKNQIRRLWQQTRDPQVKRLLNSKVKFIRSILITHKTDQWDTFVDSLNTKDGSIYKL
ncbi:unnamed protein product [Macrosiphum euphorbiae]|uniref:Uncharacterized protein n=1 Tax=Macrosiphum euphorbiae TaxID=13131 RepID=A0AAV0VQA0_9HEMI|nr:unnamed protein product [Macrosiphum euphorbiae]